MTSFAMLTGGPLSRNGFPVTELLSYRMSGIDKTYERLREHGQLRGHQGNRQQR
jgi:hypothetical protein